ncbi:nitrogen regulatory protein P-II [Desulfarculus baarsii DSM 2075]|uniref:Nitrogen regulatory protein P-II n=1 Tax=Desulfarculus baarsii (strain ATCC 33931 / DSM 2075 / LMG 7858 / VKM B-1802 / 2st14) TaxID=644282 RepID=E1QIU2_DESB2|nr:P-II family nitrogen regulator [Desulfarculus baarsii]ADK84515.1 nitrogen regulatory protein P-II [Desulfarculus baarsii DSM 2075]
MKLIIAYIKPERLNDVKQALYEAQIFNMSVTNVVGSGRQRGFSETYRGVEQEVNLIKKVRLEIGVNDNFVEAAKAAIVKGARTGQIGDGVLFVLPVEESMRIRTGEAGPPAMG